MSLRASSKGQVRAVIAMSRREPDAMKILNVKRIETRQKLGSALINVNARQSVRVTGGWKARGGAGRVATEDDGLVPSAEARANPAGRRHATALFTLSLAGLGVRASVLRFPPTVHGDGDHGFVATLAGIARQRGVAGYVGDGTNRWPAVHRSDAARLARLAIEAAPAGSVLHAVGDEGVPFREIAQAMSRRLGIPTASVTPADAPQHFGHLGHFVALDCPATAAITRKLLRWEPAGPRLLEDLGQDHYYRQD